jgi:surfeit locus 1 family protein
MGKPDEQEQYNGQANPSGERPSRIARPATVFDDEVSGTDEAAEYHDEDHDDDWFHRSCSKLARMSRFYGGRGVAVASVAALAVVILGLLLGSWQLRRADEKAAQQLAQDLAEKAPAIELGLPPGAPAGTPAPLPAPTAVDGQRVQVTGVFVPERSVFLDNRTREAVAGLHVMTPLRLAGREEHVMVLRGWVARDRLDRKRLPAVVTPSEEVRVVGLAVVELKQPLMLGEEPVPGPNDRLWQHFNYGRFSAWAGIKLHPVVLRQTVEPDYRDGLARNWNQPGLSVDRHRGYAFQWFAMTAAAVVIWLVLLWRRKAGSDGDPSDPVAGR